MKKLLIIISFILLIIAIAEAIYIFKPKETLSFLPQKEVPVPKPLQVYSFPELKHTQFPINDITLGSVIEQTTDYTKQVFYISVPEKPKSSVMKKISGVINMPNKPGTYPVIVMFRGYVSEEIYEPGIGSQPMGKFLASHGFITIAPDFLGFGESDKPSEDGFESRFQTYTTALTLLSSLETLNTGLTASYAATMSADLDKVGMWGHSNGGQIALSALEISGKAYPTVLWAPVSTSFPYSILYYTDEADDQGKALRIFLSLFEKNYDTDAFSFSNYYKWIKAPIEINQGMNDQEVPYWWSDSLVRILKDEDIDVTYNVYPEADHNFLPNGWSKAAEDSLDFYNKYLSP